VSVPTNGVLIAGTGSNVGKSLIVTGLLRWCRQRGISAAPFKGQNMALNSAVTVEGGEVARAQAVQARAGGVELTIAMNPVLIKPTGRERSQLIVRGHPVGEIATGRWIATKRELLSTVVASYEELAAHHELVIAEGAGSAGEINLLDGDLANLRLASAIGMGTVLVGDLEPGGVFASIYGHYLLVGDEYRSRLRGFILNRVRGDGMILTSGIEELTGRLGTEWFGNVPLIRGYLPGEDALNLGATFADFETASVVPRHEHRLRVRVVELPYLANYTDFDPLILESDVELRFVRRPDELDGADLVILPGTKATVAALAWLRESEIAAALSHLLDNGVWLLGICGGYQMLTEEIDDRIESRVGRVDGLGLLRAQTVFGAEKVLANVVGSAPDFGGAEVRGYQIHHGVVKTAEDPLFLLGIADVGSPSGATSSVPEGARRDRQIVGTTVHGLFDHDDFRRRFLKELAQARGRSFESKLRFGQLVEDSLDQLAETLDASLNVARLLGLDSAGH
jgi:adenosylcobyric acid synthase